MRLQAGTPGDLCIDTDQVLTDDTCALLVSRGVKGVFRYLSDIQPTERDAILGSGLVLYFVNHSRAPGWIPSAALGIEDAKRDLKDLERLAIPVGVHVSFDLEGVGGGNPQSVIAHVDAHAAGIQASKNLQALYVGDETLLTSAQLYALKTTLYWHSCSRVLDMLGNEAAPACGWACYQLYPDDVKLSAAAPPPETTSWVGRLLRHLRRTIGTPPSGASVTVDWNVIQQDFKGRVPIGVAE